MKKIGFKLLLSGVALAACAATLSTTTYAWYVTNSEATATGVTGTTASAASDGNILVAKNNAEKTGAGAFSQTINFAGDTANLITPALNPVSKDTEAITPAEGATGWHKVDNSPAVAADSYIAFDIWVMSTKETTVTVELTTVNTTPAASLDGLKQTCYNATGAPVAQGETFVVDAVEALRMEVTQDSGTPKVLSVKGISTSHTTTATGFTAADGDTDAQAYYAALLGNAPAGGATEADPAETFTTITVTENVATKLSFKIWLEGTDSMCFDSCSGQSFSFDFKFSTSNTPEVAA